MPAGYNGNQYNQWSGGKVELTKPIRGNKLTSLEAANRLCQDNFGSDWRMAAHHDGWGWGFLAKGKLKSSKRFWVYINDQNANCWDNTPKEKIEPPVTSGGFPLKPSKMKLN